MSLFSQRAERTGSDSMKWQKYAGSDILPMWVADMDFPAAPPIIEALRERVEHSVFGYSLPNTELPEVVCTYFQRRWRWQIEPEWITFSPGLGVALHTVCRMNGLERGGIVTPRPIYTAFRNAPAWAGKRMIEVGFRLDQTTGSWLLDDPAAAAAAGGGADILMLCNPHNPNGKVFGRKELEALAAAAEAGDWLICADEVHADLILERDCRHFPIASLAPEISRRTITLQSPSKAFNLPGLNFGVVVIEDEKLRNRYRQAARGQVIDQLNPLGMAAGQAAWSGNCDEWLKQLIDHLRANRDLISEAIAAIDGISMPHLAATYLAWMDVSALNLADASAHFIRHRLGMSPGAQYGDNSFMRLNFGTDRKTVQEACRRLANAAQAA
ncbi:MAG: PatB family C-S lyase [Betaproteobacteria bacterium]|nr:PatB family C-S lyase [Betaproteobacteria bacterium]